MYRTWTAVAADAEELARLVEGHLNEFAGEVISVAYAVDHSHHALLVYRPIQLADDRGMDVAVATAEQIIDDCQT